MRLREYYGSRKNQIVTAVFLIAMFVACSPLISRYCINGHDLEYHLLRIESLKEGIAMGRPFLKVNTLFFGNAGYASSMFYPDFLLYIPALLRCIGVSINASYHIFIAVCLIACYISTYLCVRHMTGSSYGAMIAAVTLTLSQYHLDDIYIRSAVGEYTAFIFIPVVVYALYNAIYEEMDKPWLFIVGYTGLILSHTATFIMCTAFGIASVFIFFKKTLLNRKVLKRLCFSTILTLLFTCSYWLPLLEQLLTTQFYVNTPWMQPKDEAVSFMNIFGSVFPALGSVCILILIPRIFIRKSRKDRDIIVFADFLIITGTAFTLFACDILPWDRLGKYAGFIQFPWRFFIMGSVLFPMAAGIIYGRITGSDEEVEKILVFDKDADSSTVSAGAVILIIILVINGISGFNVLRKGSQGYYDYSDDYYSYKPFTAHVIAGEWLPQTVKDMSTLVDDSEHMTADNGSQIKYERIKNELKAEITSDYKYVDVPFIYYLGYAAMITDETGAGTALRVTGEGRNGMCRVYLNGNSRGILRVYYRGTTLMKVSDAISIITFVFMILLIIKNKKAGTSTGKEENE